MQLFFHLTQDKMKCLFLQLEFGKIQIKNDIICYDLPGSCSLYEWPNTPVHFKFGIVKRVLLICADTHSKIKEKI